MNHRESLPKDLEIVIRAIRKVHRRNAGMIFQCPDLVGFELDSIYIEICMREASDLPGMIAVLMGQHYFGHLIGLISRCLKCGNIVFDPFAKKCACFSVPNRIGRLHGESRINQNYVVACVDHIILKRSAISYITVKTLRAFFSAKRKVLRIKPLLDELYCFDNHRTSYSFLLIWPCLSNRFHDRSLCENSVILQVIGASLI